MLTEGGGWCVGGLLLFNRGGRLVCVGTIAVNRGGREAGVWGGYCCLTEGGWCVGGLLLFNRGGLVSVWGATVSGMYNYALMLFCILCEKTAFQLLLYRISYARFFFTGLYFHEWVGVA